MINAQIGENNFIFAPSPLIQDTVAKKGKADCSAMQICDKKESDSTAIFAVSLKSKLAEAT